MKPLFDGVLSRRIVALAAPAMGAMVTQTLINQADHIMVGRLPEAESIPGQAAVMASMILLWFVGGALSAISVGTQALTARRYGAGDHEGAGRVLANSVLISAVLGSLCAVVFYQLAPNVLPLLVTDKRAVAVGVPFLRWRYVAVLSMAVTASYKSFFDGLGRTYVHLIVAIAMNAVNLILNFGFIYGMWGFPRRGVEGSGLASCISSYVGLFVIIGWSLLPYLRKFHVYSAKKLSWKMITELLRLSSPSGVAVWISLAGFGFFYYITGTIDPARKLIYQAATGNVISIFMMVFISCMAYGTATATLVGHGMAKKDFTLANAYVIEALKIGVLVYSALAVFTLAFPTVILHAFCKDQAVIDAALPVVKLLGLFEPVMCVALVFTYALYGAGNPRFVMLVEFTLHFFCLIPLSYVLAIKFGLGMIGAWTAMVTYIGAMAVIMAAKYATGSWKHIQI